jgi:hypothetical protein
VSRHRYEPEAASANSGFLLDLHEFIHEGV